MKWFPIALVLVVACKDKPKGSAPEPAGEPTAPPKPSHVAPKGTIAGKPFAPTVVLLTDSSDGGRLGFYAATDETLRDRARCAEPMGSASTFEISKYHPIADWQVGKPLTSELGDWSATGVDWNAKPKGSAKVTLSKKDPKTFTVEGTIEITGDGWSLTGPFKGDYCPTKVVPREKPAPLAAREWTMAPIAATDVPTTPLEAIVAGVPAKIAHVTLREVKYHDGTKRQRFVFYTAKPPEPCGARDASRIDNFSLDLAAAPAAGDTLAGNYQIDPEKREQIADADLQVFEPDGYRSWRYAQYYSAALAVDAVTETEVRAHVQLSLPDQGKSMLVGTFAATRCPAEN